MDRLEILVEMKSTLQGKQDASVSAQSLAQRIKGYIGIHAEIRVLSSGTIERSVGKARRVIDRRPTAC